MTSYSQCLVFRLTFAPLKHQLRISEPFKIFTMNHSQRNCWRQTNQMISLFISLDLGPPKPLFPSIEIANRKSNESTLHGQVILMFMILRLIRNDWREFRSNPPWEVHHCRRWQWRSACRFCSMWSVYDSVKVKPLLDLQVLLHLSNHQSWGRVIGSSSCHKAGRGSSRVVIFIGETGTEEEWGRIWNDFWSFWWRFNEEVMLPRNESRVNKMGEADLMGLHDFAWFIFQDHACRSKFERSLGEDEKKCAMIFVIMMRENSPYLMLQGCNCFKKKWLERHPFLWNKASC